MKNLKAGDKVRCIEDLMVCVRGGVSKIEFEKDHTYQVTQYMIDNVLDLSQYFEHETSTPKPTAVLVTTKRELKTLLTDYEKKHLLDDTYNIDMITSNRIYPMYVEFKKQPYIIEISDSEAQYYTILPFSEYAKIAGIEVKEDKPEKRYIVADNNMVPEYRKKHIKLRDTVIVVDGSYMINKTTGEHTDGINFTNNGMHELLTVTDINKPFPTDYGCPSDCLQHQNNCEITGFDGSIYYCSKINILWFLP
jgi:hypothetical protein